MTEKSAIEYPVDIFKMWKSPRDRKRTIVGAFKQYEGHVFLDCRLFDTNASGQTVPTNKGVTVGIAQLQQFADGVNRALETARSLGLLKVEPAE
ncbi:hypothetical protein CQ14_31010 [Bradyrhizobium lablabi]|uniref:Uncharacterized protein n=1 Tax=Bradyrhizobium lablabi TaxID=722472 RepID=A0A0R3MY00_9BRAD|nr:PC4/YdbC family ssDNA-binding protein [Bradyrhizobium lablabi]KRR22640.1 hypothetical protein CQ14_31010 [Bradyrhizobium lablabi]